MNGEDRSPEEQADRLQNGSPGVTSRVSRQASPLVFLLVTTLSILVADLFLRYLLVGWKEISPGWEAVFDGLFLTALVFPILYYFLYQPLVRRFVHRSA